MNSTLSVIHSGTFLVMLDSGDEAEKLCSNSGARLVIHVHTNVSVFYIDVP